MVKWIFGRGHGRGGGHGGGRGGGRGQRRLRRPRRRPRRPRRRPRRWLRQRTRSSAAAAKIRTFSDVLVCFRMFWCVFERFERFSDVWGGFWDVFGWPTTHFRTSNYGYNHYRQIYSRIFVNFAYKNGNNIDLFEHFSKMSMLQKSLFFLIGKSYFSGLRPQ